MSKYLVIVESPAKARTINRYLGNDYTVAASMGHVRDLPQKKIGIDIDKGWKPTYQALGRAKKTLTQLKSKAKGAETVYLATDPDREGEAIAWHLKEALKLTDDNARRVAFNEITKTAIRAAFDHPGQIDMNRVNAQQARRFLDRVVGYKLSPLLWKKIRKGLSAGRVQSVAVRLVVEREREIERFVPEEYWRLAAIVWPHGEERPDDPKKLLRAELQKKDGEKVEPKSEDDIKAILADIEGSPLVITEIKRTESKQRPAPPYITSTLQQQASTRLRMSTKRTMQVAQQLYEGIDVGSGGSTGLITYMRTDSVNVSRDALSMVRDYVGKRFAPEYLPEKPNFFKKRAAAQAAHEAIRPTDVNLTPDSVKKYLDKDQFRLYELIWKRFVSSQMAPAVFDNTEVVIETKREDEQSGAPKPVYRFGLKGRRLKFPGFTEVMGRTVSKEEQQELPHLEERMAMDLVEPPFKSAEEAEEAKMTKAVEAPEGLVPTQHFTEPPPRFNEASLVRALEQQGIGRPSTYAPIISTIQDRGYVEQKERRFYATELGCLVTDKLVKHFPKIMDVAFTSRLEDELDEVEEGKMDYIRVLNEFYGPFAEHLDKAADEMETEKGKVIAEGVKCAECGGDMVVRWSKHGKFLGCANYPKCKYIMPLDDEEKGEAGGEPDPKERTCEVCGEPMVLKEGRSGKYLACSKYPECKNTKTLDKDLNVVEVPEEMKTCEECGGEMLIRKGRKGMFIGCSNYPKCKNTKPLPGQPEPPKPVQTDIPCDKCQSPMLIRTGKRGRFLACSAFPKCRNIKPVPTGKTCPECGEKLVEGMRKGGTVHRCSKKGCKYAVEVPTPKPDAKPWLEGEGSEQVG